MGERRPRGGAPNSRSWTALAVASTRRRQVRPPARVARCRARSPRRRAARRRDLRGTSGISASLALRLSERERERVAVGLGERRATCSSRRRPGSRRSSPSGPDGSAAMRSRMRALSAPAQRGRGGRSRRRRSSTRTPGRSCGTRRAIRAASRLDRGARRRVAGDHARSRRAGSRCGSRRRRTPRSAAPGAARSARASTLIAFARPSAMSPPECPPRPPLTVTRSSVPSAGSRGACERDDACPRRPRSRRSASRPPRCRG